MREYKVHHYASICTWEGSTGMGYEKYDRAHNIVAPPAEQPLRMSSDPAFRGDPKRLNPEQLFVAAASSCQLLSFLAVAARANIDIRRYEDNAEAIMPEGKGVVSITQINLRPRIEVAAGPTEEQIQDAVRLAHEECYVANSVKTQVVVVPTIVFV